MNDEKLTLDMVIGAGGFTFRELGENLVRCFENDPGKPVPCRRCGTTWTPGAWNFYDLCDDCFCMFNGQKMNGRASTIAIINGELRCVPPSVPYFESCEEWMKAFPHSPPMGEGI